jgi:Tfp pilus assembly protein PilN
VNQIDFLPPSYRADQARRRRLVGEVALVIVCVAAMVAWYFHSSRQIGELADYAQKLQAESLAVRKQAGELTRLQGEQTTLSRQARLQRELSQPLGLSRVIAVFTKAMPPSVAITNMVVAGRKPVPAPPEAKSAAKDVKPRKASPLADEVIRIEVTGVSPSDMEVADLVRTLGESSLFTNVKMRSSRAAEVRGRSAREFRVEMEVPLDREFRIGKPPEVARAR